MGQVRICVCVRDEGKRNMRWRPDHDLEAPVRGLQGEGGNGANESVSKAPSRQRIETSLPASIEASHLPLGFPQPASDKKPSPLPASHMKLPSLLLSPLPQVSLGRPVGAERWYPPLQRGPPAAAHRWQARPCHWPWSRASQLQAGEVGRSARNARQAGGWEKDETMAFPCEEWMQRTHTHTHRRTRTHIHTHGRTHTNTHMEAPMILV